MLDRQNPRHDLMGGLQALRVVAHGRRLGCPRVHGELDTKRGRVVHRLGVDAANEPAVRDDSPHPPGRHFEARRLEGVSQVSVAAAFFLFAKAMVLGQSTVFKNRPQRFRRPENLFHRVVQLSPLSCV